jgi:hypothetical protein
MTALERAFREEMAKIARKEIPKNRGAVKTDDVPAKTKKGFDFLYVHRKTRE